MKPIADKKNLKAIEQQIFKKNEEKFILVCIRLRFLSHFVIFEK